MSVLRIRANKKGSKGTRDYHMSVIWKKEDQKYLSSINIIWTRANQKRSYTYQYKRGKYAMNKTKYEEPLVTDNSVINAPSYFKPLKCSRTLLNNLDATYELESMKTLKGNYDREVIKYQQLRIAELKEKYYIELSNIITNFNDNNNTPLSNVKILKLAL